MVRNVTLYLIVRSSGGWREGGSPSGVQGLNPGGVWGRSPSESERLYLNIGINAYFEV